MRKRVFVLGLFCPPYVQTARGLEEVASLSEGLKWLALPPIALLCAGNEGLEEVMSVLEGIKAQCAPITFADLAQLAAVVAAEGLGGPRIDFRPGRRDSRVSPPQGRLPAFQNCERAPAALPPSAL